MTARVTVVDEAALREAAAWAVEQGIVVVVYDDADAEDEDAGEETVGALEVLVEPTAGLRPLLDSCCDGHVTPGHHHSGHVASRFAVSAIQPRPGVTRNWKPTARCQR